MFKVQPFAVKLVVASDAPEDLVKQAALDSEIYVQRRTAVPFER